MWEVGRTQSSIGKSMLLLAQFSGIWEIFSLFTALLFTSSEVDELEKSNCSVKLGISLFVSM